MCTVVSSVITVAACVSCVLSHRIPDIYARLRQSIDKSDSAVDLKWWSDNYGASMTMAWPHYEVNTYLYAVS